MQGASEMHHELFVCISNLVAPAEGPRSSPGGVMNDRCGVLTLSGIVRYEKLHYYGYTVTMDPVKGVEKHHRRS